MVFKRKRKGGRGRRYARRAARGARRGASMGLGFFGLSRSGLRVGRAISAGSAVGTLIVPGLAISGKTYSPINIIRNKDGIAPTLTDKLNLSLFSIASTGLGVAVPLGNLTSEYQNSKTKGICGKGVLTGVGITVAGKFINPMLRGSPAKF